MVALTINHNSYAVNNFRCRRVAAEASLPCYNDSSELAGGDFMGTVRIYDAKQNKVVTVEKIEKTDAEWKRLLTADQYEITTRKGTEVPGTCTFDQIHEPGIFRCVRCGTDLFRGSTKFNSGTGWPSYYEPISLLKRYCIDGIALKFAPENKL
jgi:hypothetical protein